jgi:RNA polymerase sigma-B factor
VIHKGNAKVHVSGHAGAGELVYCYNVVKPRHVMPVHGEFRHLRANADLAIRTGADPDRVVIAARQGDGSRAKPRRAGRGLTQDPGIPAGDRGRRAFAGQWVGEEAERRGGRMMTTTVQAAGRTADVPEITDPSKVAPKDARELSKVFFDQLAVLEEGTPEYQYARNTLIEMNMSLVRYAAGRFRSRGPEEMEDIVQVGMIGLIKAIDRFELTREVEFTSFAVPYIVGEIKRFFRDTSWAVHVPRRLQEARVQLARANEELRSRLGRTPTTKELSELMCLPEDEVVEARLAANGYKSASLDAAINGSEDGEAALADFIGDEDAALGLIEDFHALAPMIAELDERDRKIIHWRFVEELTQAQIGERLGVSQMHVSRLISRLLARLREGMLSTA